MPSLPSLRSKNRLEGEDWWQCSNDARIFFACLMSGFLVCDIQRLYTGLRCVAVDLLRSESLIRLHNLYHIMFR
jgi:hypothetical protein